MGGGAGQRNSPGKITSCRLFPSRKLVRTSTPHPPTLELSGSAHACLTLEFYFYLPFLHVTGLAIILSSADAPLLFSCNKVKFLATRYIRNGVNKANPDRMSRSSQSLCGIKF